jgi:photosystem II stability/assembly factor-like uncharacterized protein
MGAANVYTYDVAISFAGEDRPTAEELARVLLQRGVIVFYDKDNKAELWGINLPDQLKEIYRNRARFCVLLISAHYPNKQYTRLELKAARERASSQPDYIIPVRLDDTKLRGLANTLYLQWPPEDAATIADLILTKLGRARSWHTISVQSNDRGTDIVHNNSWRDIFRIGTKIWLCGAIEEGGGGGEVGSGILLHKTDGQAAWNAVGKNAFSSGEGSFTWGPQGTRLYYWTEIGPINAISFYKRIGKPAAEGWLASSTGIYRSDNEGVTWQRSTPPPNHPDRYAFFANSSSVEAFSEIYAVGWQGIAHYSSRTDAWSLQLPSYFYDIKSVSVLGGSENRSVWAVGRAGIDEQGNHGDRSHGAVYRLNWPTNRWERLPLDGVQFSPGQALSDILQLDDETILVAGEKGMILLGTWEDGNQWSWTTIPPQTDETLLSIGYADYTLWVVGNGGVVLKSPDRGKTWSRVVIQDNDQRITSTFRRIRFFGDEGWILGEQILLKSTRSADH